jgi:peptidyl-dipeptidase A
MVSPVSTARYAHDVCPRRRSRTMRAVVCPGFVLACCFAACSAPDRGEVAGAHAGAAASSVEDAERFVADAEAQLSGLREFVARTEWVKENFITPDTEWLVARAGAQFTELEVSLANATKQFEGVELPARLARKMNTLRTSITLPAPSTPGAATELAEISTALASAYSTGGFELDGATFGLTEAEAILDQSRDPQQLAAAWEGWRTIAEPMAAPYARMVEIANAGARELGFGDLAEMWLSNYGMTPAAVEAEVERLWGQVAPLYEALHCHVRDELSRFYGEDVQPASGPIRADLLGNMWAQHWSNIYDLVAPPETTYDLDLTQILLDEGYDERRMIATGEAFFVSLGFEPLPASFWEQSLIEKPRDRDVTCHASAWDIDQLGDVRIKMCTQINAEDFRTVHHELGHNFYQRAYAKQDYLFRDGANDAFHEAIGDFIGLSITPEYLREIGLIDTVPDASADLGLLMQQALDKIAFLPFGLLVDQWRWRVLRGEVGPADYNSAWWALRLRYQGIEPPVARPAGAFDPGAKFHIPGNTPYLRYFLSYILQFQFHAAACEIAGWTGPLHRCSIYGNREVGRRLEAMLALGRSEPWPDALETFTGRREIDAAPIIEYFAPLMAYLKERNATRACGW